MPEREESPKPIREKTEELPPPSHTPKEREEERAELLNCLVERRLHRDSAKVSA